MSQDINRPPAPTLRNPDNQRRAQGVRRSRGILALVAAVVVVSLFATVLVTLANQRSQTAGQPTPPVSAPTQPIPPTSVPPTSVPPATPTMASGAFTVTSVTMAVTPATIANTYCGEQMTVTYTATMHVAPNSPGGTVQFGYTVNNGRGQTNASLTFNPGDTSKTYTFTWSGALPADHTYPQPGGVQVTSPNQLTSALVAPTGQCTPVTAPTCGANFSGQPYQNTLTTDFGTVPLPPYSLTVPDDASGGQRGADMCSAGTAAMVTAFMEQNLPAYGWTFVSKSGGIETWQSSKGTINVNVADPLNWIISWRVPLG